MLLLLILALLLVSSAIQLGTWVDSTLPKAERLLLGIGTQFSLLVLTNLFVPISVWVSGAIVVVPATFFILSFRQSITSQSLKILLLKKRLPLLLLGGFIFAVSYAGSFPTTWYDSLLYHVPSVTTMTQSPIVSGLALLHIRLAATSLPFVFSSLQASIPTLSSFNLPSVLFVVLLGVVILLEKDTHTTNLSLKNSNLMLLGFSLLFLLSILKASLLSTLAPELSLFVWVSLLLYGFLEKRHLLVLLAFVLGISTKISMVLFVPFVLLGFLETLYQARSLSPLFHRPRVFIATLLPLLSWSLFSFIVSGCFVFPVKQTCMPLRNALIPSQVVEYTETVYTWARHNPYQPLIQSETQWFSSVFIRSIPVEIFGILLVATALLCIAIVRGKQNKIQLPFLAREINALLLLVLIVLAAYKTAPDFRLLWPLVLSFLSMYLAWALFKFQDVVNIPPTAQRLFLIVLCMITFITFGSDLHAPLRKSQLLYPIETIYNRAASRQTHPFSFTTPISGDDRCGAASFPCIVDPSVLTDYAYSVDATGKLTGVYHP